MQPSTTYDKKKREHPPSLHLPAPVPLSPAGAPDGAPIASPCHAPPQDRPPSFSGPSPVVLNLMPHYAPRRSPRLLQISLRLAPHRRPLPPLDPPLYTEIERLARGGHYLPWGACKAADGLMGCSLGCSPGGGGRGWIVSPRPGIARLLCVFFLRTDTNAGRLRGVSIPKAVCVLA